MGESDMRHHGLVFGLALLLALHFSHAILLCRKPVEAGIAAWDRVETVASDFLLLH